MIFFEPKALYRNAEDEVPLDDYEVMIDEIQFKLELSKAEVV